MSTPDIQHFTNFVLYGYTKVDIDIDVYHDLFYNYLYDRIWRGESKPYILIVEIV